MSGSFAGFPAEGLHLLRQLKRHNNRPWFLKHKEIYEQKVKAPMVELVLALGSEIRSFAPELAVDPSRAIYRIYRDTRFSHDKSPYKTQIAASFPHRGVSACGGAGFESGYIDGWSAEAPQSMYDASHRKSMVPVLS